MQKKLMVIAVAGALTAPALAFAQASTVQIYGRITAEYGYVDQGDRKNSTDMLQTPGGSAIGFKGEEKLGGGLSAWFQCESSADVRGENQDGFCSRNSAIGMKGGFGNVYIGKWDTPFKQAMSVGDGAGSEDTGLLGTAFLMAGSSTGTSTSDNTYNTTGVGTQTLSTVGRNIWKRRQQESVNYNSPSFSGFQVNAAYSTGNAATAGTDTTLSAKPRVASIAGIYKNGPIKAAVGYEKHYQFGVNGTQELDDDAWVIAGAYNFGKVEIGGAYNVQKYQMGGATGDIEKTGWTIGVDWDLSGPHSVGANYTNADLSGGAVSANIGNTVRYTATGENASQLYQIYYGHAFSKRTTAKVAYVHLDNDQNATQTLGGVKGVAGATQYAFVLLVKHVF
jgi:predicted porin